MDRNSKERENIPIEDKLEKLNFSQGFKFDENKHLIRNSASVNDCYVCVRPGNKINVPKINVKILKNAKTNNVTTIVNNYGHGGIGWSLMWGSVLKAIEFSNITKNPNLASNNPPKIAIIGSGANGLATALLLIHQGINTSNITIFTKNDTDTTSHRSGAILSTASVLEKIDPVLEKIYNEVNIETFKFWEKIHQGKIFQKLRFAIKKVKAYFGAEKDYGCIETDSGLDIFVNHGLIPKPELVRMRFGATENLMRKYDSYYFNTFRLMNALSEYVKKDFAVPVVLREISDLEALAAEGFQYVFNCAGVENSVKLNFDSDILPIGGHIVTLKNQKICDFDYVIYSHYIHKEDVGKYTHTNAPLFYLMLKTDDKTFSGLLGGSLLNNYEGGDEVKDEFEYKQILKRTLEIFGEDPRKFLEMSESDAQELRRAEEMKNNYKDKDAIVNAKPKF